MRQINPCSALFLTPCQHPKVCGPLCGQCTCCCAGSHALHTPWHWGNTWNQSFSAHAAKVWGTSGVHTTKNTCHDTLYCCFGVASVVKLSWHSVLDIWLADARKHRTAATSASLCRCTSMNSCIAAIPAMRPNEVLSVTLQQVHLP